MEILNLEAFEELVSETLSEEKEEIITSINTETEYPHILFRKTDLLKMLQLSVPIINFKSSNIVSKAITIKKDTDYKFIVNNDIEYIDYTFEVLNSDNRIEEPICIPITTIQSILKLMDNFILIYKKDNSFFIRLLLEGDLYLEVGSPMPYMLERFTSMDNLIKADEVNYIVNGDHLNKALRAEIPLLSEELMLEKKRLNLLKDRIYFNTNKLMIQYRLGLPSMRLSERMCNIIRRLTDQFPKESVRFFTDKKNESRIVILCNNVYISGTFSRVYKDERILRELDSASNNKKISFELNKLVNIINAVNSLTYTDGKVGFSLDNDLKITINTKNRMTSFKIPVTNFTNSTFKDTIWVSGIKLKKILDTMNRKDVVSFTIEKDKLIFNYYNITAILEV